RRAGDLGHAGVELGEPVALAAGVGHVDAGRDQASGVGDEIRAGLDLQVKRAPGAVAEVDQLLTDVCPDVGEIGGALLRYAGHLEAAAEVDRGDVGETPGDVEAHPRHVLPHCRIGPRPDVGVEAAHDPAVARDQCRRLVEMLVPDAEARAGPAGVGTVGRAAA